VFIPGSLGFTLGPLGFQGASGVSGRSWMVGIPGPGAFSARLMGFHREAGGPGQGPGQCGRAWDGVREGALGPAGGWLAPGRSGRARHGTRVGSPGMGAARATGSMGQWAGGWGICHGTSCVGTRCAP